MKKKIIAFIIALVCVFALGTVIKTNAYTGDGDKIKSYPQAYYTDVAQLGLSNVTVDYTATFGEELTVVRNGFKFTRSGDIATVEPADDAATINTLYYSFTIDGKTVAPEQYLELDYTQFPNVRNVVINCDLPNGILAKINKLRSIQNVFIIQGCNLTNLNNPQIKNYVFLENQLSDSYSLATQEYLNLSEYNRTANFVTIESLKYVALTFLRTYTQNPNYTGTEAIDLLVVKDDEFIKGVLPENYSVNTTKAVNGGYYVKYLLTGYSTTYYVLVDIHPDVKKIFISEDVVDNFHGVYIDIPVHLEQVYFSSDQSGYSKLHADVLIIPAPTTLINKYYKNFKEVYFYKSSIGATKTVNIKAESLEEGEEITTKYYFGSSVEAYKQITDTTLYDSIIYGQTAPKASFTIHHNGYIASTTSTSKTVQNLIDTIELYGLGTNNNVTVVELVLEPVEVGGETVEMPEYPDEELDDNKQENNDNKDETNNEPNEDNKDENNDKEENKETLKDKANKFFQSFKEKFEQNKAVKAVTIIVSVTFGLGLIYLAYVLIKKFTKFFK